MNGSRQLQAALRQGSTRLMCVQQSCRANSSTLKLPTRYFFMKSTSSAMSLMWLVSEGASWPGWRPAPLLSQQGCVILSAIVCQIQLKAFAFFFFFLQLGCVNFPCLILQIIILKELSPCLVSLPGVGEGDTQGCFPVSWICMGRAWCRRVGVLVSFLFKYLGRKHISEFS